MATTRTPARTVTVDGRRIRISNPDKVLFPASGITKHDLAEYYRRVAPVMLPHLRGRPVTLHRFPDGIGKFGFYQKDTPEHFPDWIRRARLPKEGGHVDYLVCEDAATLVYLADQASIVLHVGLSCVDRPQAPDRVVFDLDPSEDDFAAVRRAAREVAALLDELGLVPFVQTTGSRGLHVWAPLDASATFERVRPFAHAAADVLARRHPERLTTAHRKAKRGGRLFLDTLRNGYGQTAVAPYSVRAREGAPVATPLHRREIDRSGLTPDGYRLESLFRRLGRIGGDPWADIERAARPLDAAERALEALTGRR